MSKKSGSGNTSKPKIKTAPPLLPKASGASAKEEISPSVIIDIPKSDSLERHL